jgi:hypothetical protein
MIAADRVGLGTSETYRRYPIASWTEVAGDSGADEDGIEGNHTRAVQKHHTAQKL